MADAAAAAVLGAQRALEARSNREALELLFELSASLTNDDDVDTVLHTAVTASAAPSGSSGS